MELNIDYFAIGKRVKAARLKKKMTQETLAHLTDLAPTYISSIENGKTKLSLPTLIQFARQLDTTVDALLYDNTPILFTRYDADIKEIMEDCNTQERVFLIDLLKMAKDALRASGLSVEK